MKTPPSGLFETPTINKFRRIKKAPQRAGLLYQSKTKLLTGFFIFLFLHEIGRTQAEATEDEQHREVADFVHVELAI